VSKSTASRHASARGNATSLLEQVLSRRVTVVPPPKGTQPTGLVYRRIENSVASAMALGHLTPSSMSSRRHQQSGRTAYQANSRDSSFRSGISEQPMIPATIHPTDLMQHLASQFQPTTTGLYANRVARNTGRTGHSWLQNSCQGQH
jgi:hypothetical protein